MWLNGEPVGAHDGGYTGFALEVGDLLRAGGDNFLAVRVITPLITRDVRIDGLGRDEMPHWRGAIAGGIWQPVRLAATGPLRVTDLTVIAEPRSGAVEAAVEWENTTTRGMRAEVRLAVYAGAAAVAAATAEHTLEAAPGRGTLAARLRVPGPALWDLEQPNLYRLQVEVLAGGAGSDLAERRFGFREFTRAHPPPLLRRAAGGRPDGAGVPERAAALVHRGPEVTLDRRQRHLRLVPRPEAQAELPGVVGGIRRRRAHRIGAWPRPLPAVPVPDRAAPGRRSGSRPAAGQPPALGRRCQTGSTSRCTCVTLPGNVSPRTHMTGAPRPASAPSAHSARALR